MNARQKTLGIVTAVALTALAIVSCSDAAKSSACEPSSQPPALSESTTTPAAGDIVKTSFPTKQGEPFAEPPTITSKNGVLETSFETRTCKYVVAGRVVSGMTYAGDFLGPTLQVDPGDTIKIDLRNSLDQETNFHSHGMHTSPIQVSDNVLRVMKPDSNNKVEIKIPAEVAPGTYWYHAHLHGLTEPQVFSGLAGALVVTGLTERLPTDLQTVPDHLIALRDLQLDSTGTIPTTNINSDASTTRTVNGQVNPVIEAKPGAAQLLRIANLSADIWYRVKLDGSPFTLLAEDANPMGVVTDADELVLPPAKRFDVLVRWDKPGRYHLRTLPYSTGPAGDNYPARVLSTFTVAGAPVAKVKFPTSMGAEPDLQLDTITTKRSVVFSENDTTNQFFINGKQFSGNTPMFTAKLGTTEEWTIKNVTKEQHPFHIHVNDFQVMSINGVPQKTNSLRDTQMLPVGGTVVIRMRFEDFVGRYVFHCHILAHEDGGMMAVLQVTEDGKPASQAQADEWGQGAATHTMPGM